jgi:hypothetical protein
MLSNAIKNMFNDKYERNISVHVSESPNFRVSFEKPPEKLNNSPMATFRMKLGLPKVNTMGVPFYYFAPRPEGLGARWTQLKSVAHKVIVEQNRTLILAPYIYLYHNPDGIYHRMINYCDYIEFSIWHCMPVS